MRRNVVVLGSRGQIGLPLAEFLDQCGYDITEIDLDIDVSHDLRRPSPFLRERFANADFVFFLAYDVGGSRYLRTYQNTKQFLDSNVLIMTTVFNYLQEFEIPFIFASSQMSNMSFSAYGSLKTLGEHYTRALGGVFVKFWNVYGYESNKNKAHVITDFIDSAMKTGTIQMMTDGHERREFLHVDDCKRALRILMENYKSLDILEGYDITSFHSASIYEVAEIVSSLTGAIIKPGESADDVQHNSLNIPRKTILSLWRPEISLLEGIQDVIKHSRNLSD